MADLNTIVLNGETLGSGSRVNAYGGAIVSGGSTATLEAVGSLAIPAFIRKLSFVCPLVVIGTIPIFVTVRSNGNLYGAAEASCSVSPRVLVHASAGAAPTLEVNGTLSGWVKTYAHLRGTMTMAVTGSLLGNDLSRTPAPSDRISTVPVNDRTSYAQRG